jgi:hypothetical protein
MPDEQFALTLPADSGVCPNPVILPEPEFEPAENGPVMSADQQTLWHLWSLYGELDRCSPDRVPVLRSAIAYLGGSLKVRYPVPASIREQVPNDIPVRRA